MFRVPGATWMLNHGCFFALGIWLFISANRTLTTLEWVAVAVTCLSGCAEIYYFSDFLLKAIPAISDESVFLPILVWAAAVLLIGFAANKNRRLPDTASPEAPAYLRTLGLITYPLYLTHNVTGTAMIRVLTDAGLDASLAVWASLSHACPGLLVHLREDRARHSTAAEGIRFKLQTASESSAGSDPYRSASHASPSAAHAVEVSIPSRFAARLAEIRFAYSRPAQRRQALRAERPYRPRRRRPARIPTLRENRTGGN